MNLDHVLARHFKPIHQSYDWRDCALYALGLGVGDDPLDEDELAYVYEGRDQQAVPSMCVTLGWPPLWIAEPQTGIAWTKALHGEQRFALHRPLSASGSVRAEHRVSAIADKGSAHGALLYFDTELFDQASGERLASLRATDFLRGDGGCGSHGTPPGELARIGAGAKPSAAITYRTPRHAALLYRLVSRDYMPIHADPVVAREAGFDQPISHGLNTMGLACRAVLKRYAPGHPERIGAMAVRFVSPAFPGDTIRIEMFEEDETIRFRAWAVERQMMVLDRGECRLATS
ncbi:MaoC/PaaZ C-terminal domain-containing protein [Bradyrhizobium sp. LA2.1]|uniref:MaoC/PaaZ C-terminal domain-containing protein n=1 Tax=Bradyrhizobium sp. LA2.1 TaxID=3156376 RepID=UPI0033918DB5